MLMAFSRSKTIPVYDSYSELEQYPNTSVVTNPSFMTNGLILALL